MEVATGTVMGVMMKAVTGDSNGVGHGDSGQQ